VNIPAIQIAVGDFVPEVGIVKNVRLFQGQKSVLGKTRASEEKDYVSQIASELDACYSHDVCNVVLEGTMGTRSFLPNDSVKVFRVELKKAKSEAA
jgi:hypothetical protein